MLVRVMRRYFTRVLEAPSAAMKLRAALLLPVSCRWNAFVRDLTAQIEGPKFRYGGG